MAVSEQQLTFEVGGQTPDLGRVRVAGAMFVTRDLSKGDEVHVVVSGMDGEVLADGYGHVAQVAFKDVRDKDNVIVATERIHSLKVT